MRLYWTDDRDRKREIGFVCAGCAWLCNTKLRTPEPGTETHRKLVEAACELAQRSLDAHDALDRASVSRLQAMRRKLHRGRRA